MPALPLFGSPAWGCCAGPGAALLGAGQLVCPSGPCNALGTCLCLVPLGKPYSSRGLAELLGKKCGFHRPTSAFGHQPSAKSELLTKLCIYSVFGQR